MFKSFILVVLLTSSCVFVHAQQFSITGSIKDSVDQEPLIGVNIVLTHKSDTLKEYYSAADLEGNFNFPAVPSGTYQLRATYIGYSPLFTTVNVKQQSVHLGSLYLSPSIEMMDELVITGKVDQSRQMGDTTQFNAGAFKTAPYASGQDLVEKMPGITTQNGKLQAQGEAVQQILVDGKPFFGKDVNAALQNLPAEVIASVQVFDKKSDKAELSGFDDGQRIKTINIVTKPNRRRGQFGKTSAGYGTDDKYQVGASVNFFNNDRRITVTGLSNNINTLSYSADPNNEGETRTQSGLIKTNAIGLNFSDEWADKIEISGSYYFRDRQSEGSEFKFRDYLLPSDSGQVYKEDSYDNRTYNDHFFDMRFDYDINDRNRILIRPAVSLQHHDYNNYFMGRTTTDNGPLNQTENNSNSSNLDYDFNNNLYYSHKFRKKGRSFLFHLNTGYHTNDNDGSQLADNIFYRATDSNKILHQNTSLNRTGLSWETEFSYAEPVGKKGQAELEYSIGNRIDDSDKLTYNIDEHSTEYYSSLDTALSNTFNSEYLTQELELGYQYRVEKFRFQAEAEYEQVDLRNEQEFPQIFNLKRTYNSFLPSARVVYEFSDSKNIELNYHTDTDAPSIGQLQEVIDNSNPLHLRTGNSNLDQSYRNWLRLRYRTHNPETNKSVYASLSSTFIKNLVTNSTLIAEEPLTLNDDIVMEEGSQLTRPVNVNGYFRIYSYFSYSQPVDFIKSNFNVNGGFDYTKRPGMVNEEVNFSNSSNFRLGVSLSSNISENVDFNISTRSRYHIVENSLRPTLNTNYFNQTTRFRFSGIFLNGFVYRTSLNHEFNSGLSEAYDNSIFLVNMSLGKKFFKDQRAELSLNVYDLFEQNNNISRNVTELYIEDRRSSVLERYFMLTFTYNIRHFSKGTSMKDFEDLM